MSKSARPHPRRKLKHPEKLSKICFLSETLYAEYRENFVWVEGSSWRGELARHLATMPAGGGSSMHPWLGWRGSVRCGKIATRR